MLNYVVLGAALAVLVAMWLADDRREVAYRAAGGQPRTKAPVGCAVVILAAALFAGVALWSKGWLAAIGGVVGVPVALSLASIVLVGVAQHTMPKLFPSPPAKARAVPPPPPMAAAPSVAPPQFALQQHAIALPSTAFGAPAKTFESVGPWLSIRGNCRNTGSTSAPGPRTTPRLAWRWRLEGRDGAYDHLMGCPVIDRNGVAYIGTSIGLTALNPDGSARWTVGKEKFASPALDGSGNIVSATDNALVIVAPSGEMTVHECAEIFGRYATVGDGGAIYIAGSGYGDLDSGRLTAFAPDGTKRWGIRTIRSVNYPPAIAPSGEVFFSASDAIVWNYEDVSVGYDRFQRFSANGKELEAIDLNDEGYGEVWGQTAAMSLEDGTPVVCIGDSVRIGATTLARTGGGVPALDANGTMYISHGGLLALDLLSGREKWRCTSAFGLPVIDGDGNIYATDGATIVAVSPSGDVMWKWTAPEIEGKYFGSIVALAIGVDRTLYAATLSELVALRE